MNRFFKHFFSGFLSVMRFTPVTKSVKRSTSYQLNDGWFKVARYYSNAANKIMKEQNNERS